VKPTNLDFVLPESISSFQIVQRVVGNSTTDFGAPDKPVASDAEPIEEAELDRYQKLLQACWEAFDNAATKAVGQALRKGPRGGGRDLDRIVDHVLGADQAYLRRIGWKPTMDDGWDNTAKLAHIRKEIREGLIAATHGELPAAGPRGGKRWSPRFFVRRVAWHVIDHAWEIEDRIV
jgi:hypothetical protein